MVPRDTSDRGMSVDDNSVRLLTKSSGPGGRSGWSAADAERAREHPRSIFFEVGDLARDPGLWKCRPRLGVEAVGRSSRAASRGTLVWLKPPRRPAARYGCHCWATARGVASQLFSPRSLLLFCGAPCESRGCERETQLPSHTNSPAPTLGRSVWLKPPGRPAARPCCQWGCYAWRR